MDVAVMTTSDPVPIPVASSAAADRGSLYHFLEMALAHPGEDGFAYFRQAETERALLRLIGDQPNGAVLLDRVGAALEGFFSGLRRRDFDQVEADYIALFAVNFPQVPCPPYGSLFTAEDDNKRLDEMLAIKQFYASAGVDVSENYDDLPDHLCVELEFLQLLCFREDDAAQSGDGELAAAIRSRQAQFLDRFMMPFVERLAVLAARVAPDNPYAHLIEATHHLLSHHRLQFREVLS